MNRSRSCNRNGLQVVHDLQVQHLYLEFDNTSYNIQDIGDHGTQKLNRNRRQQVGI